MVKDITLTKSVLLTLGFIVSDTIDRMCNDCMIFKHNDLLIKCLTPDDNGSTNIMIFKINYDEAETCVKIGECLINKLSSLNYFINAAGFEYQFKYKDIIKDDYIGKVIRVWGDDKTIYIESDKNCKYELISTDEGDMISIFAKRVIIYDEYGSNVHTDANRLITFPVKYGKEDIPLDGFKNLWDIVS